MSFATVDDIATRAGRAFSATEEATADALCEAATAVVAAAADKDDDWADNLDPIPRILRFVTVELVNRVMANPNALRSFSETLGAFQHSEGYRDNVAGGGLELTTSEQLMVRRAVYGRTSGSARVESTATELHDIVYGDCS